MYERGNPMPIIIGFLTYQITGWFMGKRIFESLNSEAMLFTFLTGGTALLAFLYFKMDETSRNPSYIGRTTWYSCLALGVFFGIFFRLKTFN